jgi:hypothetical protein
MRLKTIVYNVFLWDMISLRIAHHVLYFLLHYYNLRNVTLTFNVKTGFLRYTKYVSSYIRTWCNKVHCILVILIPNQVIILLQGLQHQIMRNIQWKLKVNTSAVRYKRNIPMNGRHSVGKWGAPVVRLAHRVRKHPVEGATCPGELGHLMQAVELHLLTIPVKSFTNFNTDKDLQIHEEILSHCLLKCIMRYHFHWWGISSVYGNKTIQLSMTLIP